MPHCTMLICQPVPKTLYQALWKLHRLAVACLWHFQLSVAAQLFYQSYWQSAV